MSLNQTFVLMTQVIFGSYNFKRQPNLNGEQIFDIVRNKYVALTPEEWVRQHIIHYLISEKGYPKALLAIEKEINLNGLKKRCDIVAYDTNGKPTLLVECKADNITLNETVLMQILQYNQKLDVRYLWVTNGHHNYCYDIKNNTTLLPSIPDYLIA